MDWGNAEELAKGGSLVLEEEDSLVPGGGGRDTDGENEEDCVLGLDRSGSGS